MHDTASILKSAGLRVTNVSLALLRTLQRDPHPVTAAELLARLPAGTDRVTVYRALERFAAHGLVRPVRIGTVCRYEWRDGHDHHHAVCTGCHKTQDIPLCAMDSMKDAIKKAATAFAELTDHSFEVFGLCKSCAKKKNA